MRCESLRVTLGIKMASQEQGQVTFKLAQDLQEGAKKLPIFRQTDVVAVVLRSVHFTTESERYCV